MAIPFLFSFHIVLMGVKIWFVWVMLDVFKIAKSTDKNLNMLVFKNRDIFLLFFVLLIIMVESWFIYSFFENVNLFPYDYISVLDQIILSILLALSYKGGKN